MIFHITSQPAWDAVGSHYTAPSLVEEGFIHASTREQVGWVANHLYRGLRDRVILVIDEAALDVPVRWEGNPPGPFPHLYGPLPVAAVTRVVPFPCGPDGSFTLPEAL